MSDSYIGRDRGAFGPTYCSILELSATDRSLVDETSTQHQSTHELWEGRMSPPRGRIQGLSDAECEVSHREQYIINTMRLPLKNKFLQISELVFENRTLGHSHRSCYSLTLTWADTKCTKFRMDDACTRGLYSDQAGSVLIPRGHALGPRTNWRTLPPPGRELRSCLYATDLR